MDNNEYIYLLQEREFIRLNENTYKIGRSGQRAFRRMEQYPKGSNVLMIVSSPDSVRFEREIINLFKSKYTKRPEYGREYFSGDLQSMLRDISSIVIG